MKVELDPAKHVVWQVVDGPEEWLDTTVDWQIKQDDDYTGRALPPMISCTMGHDRPRTCGDEATDEYHGLVAVRSLLRPSPRGCPCRRRRGSRPPHRIGR